MKDEVDVLRLLLTETGVHSRFKVEGSGGAIQSGSPSLTQVFSIINGRKKISRPAIFSN